MSDHTAFIYSSEFLKYKFGEEHPFDPRRLHMTLDLLQETGLLRSEHVVEPVAASMETLLGVHDLEFIQAVQEASKLPSGSDGSGFGHGLGTEDTPIFPNMHEAGSLIVGGTVLAADMVMSGKVQHALNIAGGLHHARTNEASGFCLYNDAAAAIAHVKQKYKARIVYIDTDAHHGDGVQWMFYDDPDVLTISLHETGKYLYPGTGDIEERGVGRGYGYSINVPLEPFTEDDSMRDVLQAVLPHVIHQFKPDLIISQNGCDAHRYDPLTHLSVSMSTYYEIPRMVHQLAHEVCDGRWVAVGGGGYDIWRVVPRAWSVLWGELSGQEIPETIPQTWLDKWQPKAPVNLPTSFMDPAFDPIPRRTEIEEKNRITVRRSLLPTPFLL